MAMDVTGLVSKAATMSQKIQLISKIHCDAFSTLDESLTAPVHYEAGLMLAFTLRLSVFPFAPAVLRHRDGAEQTACGSRTSAASDNEQVLFFVALTATKG
ncbi:hypothetical protein PY650_35810 [Rhizobium calliandrae]|uniref:Uncharacterized protein n=1 Tax=Rhizobium calliandrae TaxID=1312182 RepID=A0ABT7KQS3_9HYPH|nr:hypothetical protein [Rhizobium calliandrae]MDL2410816.1 hypothetical protein [Rhizobium calliandrae]